MGKSIRPGLALTLAVACGICTAATGASTGKLVIESDDAEIRIAIEGPARSLVGFARPPGNAAERETLSLAEENLRTGDAMIRLPTRAGCRLLDARVDADPAPGNGEDEGRLGASYRFRCEHRQDLDSVAVGLFAGFPFLARIHASYRIGTIRGEAVLTPTNPVVHLIPLQ